MFLRCRIAVLASLLAPAAGAQAPPAPAAPLASQEVAAGVFADVTEFRRKGNVLTAKLRYRNEGSEEVTLDIMYDKSYVLDAAGGRKYEVLRDDDKNYIAALGPSYSDRYWNSLEPGKPLLLWLKFPAPPAEVKTVTLQLDDAPPFDELTIQE